MCLKSFLRCGLLLVLFYAVGCREDKVDLENLKVPRLMVESRSVQYGDMGGPVVTLPVSQTSIPLQKEPVVSEFEIVNVELVKVELGLALMVQTSSTGARQLYRSSVTNMGNRIVLMINGNAVGAQRIGAAIEDGRFFTFVELPDEELGDLVLEIKDSLVELQKMKD